MKKSIHKKNENNGKFPTSDLAYRKLFEEELREIYWTEHAIGQVLPKMIKRATSESLVTLIYEQLFFTKEQIKRAEQIFKLAGCFPQSKKSVAMEGILKETQDSMKELNADVRDAGIKRAALKIIHYEIATYDSLCSIAGELGMSHARLILMQTLYEKKNTDNKLLRLS